MTEERDIAEEQGFLDEAYEALQTMRAGASTMLESVIRPGRGGTFQSRTERDIVVRTSLARLQQLDVGDQALAFGRIDFLPVSDGRNGLARHAAGDGRTGDSFHLGRLAISGKDHEPLVVDWRAPVAEPFYRATGVDPQGLARRRHLAVSGRQVTGVEDEYFSRPAPLDAGAPGAPGAPGASGASGATADGSGERALGTGVDPRELGGPGALLAALDHARTGHMADIVGTIQREQDEIIRSPLPGVLVVQGGPGTGKTAVALHRAAYLLYTYRFPLERQGVLVVGPNPLFLGYIERVLPSLGETGVSLSTPEGLVAGVRAQHPEPARLARLKGDVRMAKVVARAVATRERPLRNDLEVPFGATTLRLPAGVTASVVAAARRRRGTHNARRRFVERDLLAHLVAAYEATRSASSDGLGAVPAGLGGEDLRALEAARQEIGRRIRATPEVAAALDRMWPLLSPTELVHDLYGARPLLVAAGRGVLAHDDIDLLYRERSTALGDVAWTPADAAIIDEAHALLGPRKATGPAAESEPRAFGHIVVDEAQDLSPMQLRMLARRSISGSMTVVGDVAQATKVDAPATWRDVVSHLSPSRPARFAELTVGYRTPKEVLDVASSILAAAAPGLRAPRPVRSSGSAPLLRHAAPGELFSVVGSVAAHELAVAGGGRVAILVPGALARDALDHPALAALGALDPTREGSQGLAAPLVVLSADAAHGLEFDGVVVVEPSGIADGTWTGEGSPDAPSVRGLRALYVALTRPTRRLAVVWSRPLLGPLAGLADPLHGWRREGGVG